MCLGFMSFRAPPTGLKQKYATNYRPFVRAFLSSRNVIFSKQLTSNQYLGMATNRKPPQKSLLLPHS